MLNSHPFRTCSRIMPMRVAALFAVTILGLLVSVIAESRDEEPNAIAAPRPTSTAEELYNAFKNPPPGYGEVAFFWWVGDTLTRERLLWQLDQLKGKGVTGLQINYAHTDSGGLLWGLTMRSRPRLFSEEWWELFGWFMKEAKQRGMAVSLSDYTLGIGQGSYVDEALADHPDLTGSELKFAKRVVEGPGLITWRLPGEPLTITACRIDKDSLSIPGTRHDISAHTRAHELRWTPGEGVWMISCVWAARIVPSYDPMNELSGKVYIEKFFQRFENRFPGEAGKGINFFFSDELSFRLQYPIWNDAFLREFQTRKGYDLRPVLTALFEDIGPITPKIRLDYNDVMVSLSEEHFFQPLYEWHQKRGMTFGCDHGGRGKDVAEFGDYFRTQRWNQGPGCDQPMLQQDIIKNKVASSIAHLYRRPRVWLEGFHSSGWGTSSADIADAVFGNFVMGQNLLTLHGLYYTTHGGWWEWAPPCNHFRMPYWGHIDPLMHSVQRLSCLLSQGHHRCDVAVMYPLEPMIAGTDGEESVQRAFVAGEMLYNAGIDFDFIDYQSLARAQVENGRIVVAGEEYRVLILPSMKTIHYTSLAKALDMFNSGGTVVNLGAFPLASERGREDFDFDSLRAAVFGHPGVDASKLKILNARGVSGAVYECNDDDSLVSLVSRVSPRDFKVLSCPGGAPAAHPRILHRQIGSCEIYAVYNVAEGSECFFRSKGNVELWNPWNGDRQPLFPTHVSRDGTTLVMPLSRRDLQLVVFHSGESDVVVEHCALSSIDSVKRIGGKVLVWGLGSREGDVRADVVYKGVRHHVVGNLGAIPSTRTVVGDWGFKVEPVLDNRWGDFHWPPTPERIGPEVHRMRYSEDTLVAAQRMRGTHAPTMDTVSCSYGPQFWCLGPLPGIAPAESLFPGGVFDQAARVSFQGRAYGWRPYQFSWRWGVEGDPGHQGYHGLKEEVHDEFIRLGNPVQRYTSTERESEPKGTWYCLFTGVFSPRDGYYAIEQGLIHPTSIRINGALVDSAADSVYLKSGLNTLLLWYNRPCITFFVLRAPADSATHKPVVRDHADGVNLETTWYRDSRLLRFDARFGEAKPVGWYMFTSAPGMVRMNLAVHGTPEIFISGQKRRVVELRVRDDGAIEYQLQLGAPLARAQEVAIRVEQRRGCYGGAAFAGPIQLHCEKGLIELGDWSSIDGLHGYSGGGRYAKTCSLSVEEAKQKVEIDLGSVVSTAELWVNGKPAGLKVAPPWVFDVSTLVHEGKNVLEVLVYNTASNHYTSIPTRYRGSITSGILGPVTLRFTGHVVMRER